MSTSPPRRTVLITGCSDGGLGAALAVAFHSHGLRVFATSRDLEKMASVRSAGIETLTMDVLSAESIKHCVEEVKTRTGGTLEYLVNNAGTGYHMPISDIDLNEARKQFDLNVWAYIAVVQAFLPLLIAAKGAVIANNTSLASVVPVPFLGPYSASKAAVAMLSDMMRLEFTPFDIQVVDLKTGTVKSNTTDKLAVWKLPKGSLYEPAKVEVEKTMHGAETAASGVDTAPWAERVVRDLLKKKVPARIWSGGWVSIVWFVTTFGSATAMDAMPSKNAGMDVAERKIREFQKSKAHT
jgi:1-acylglycerone phosphate reductase